MPPAKVLDPGSNQDPDDTDNEGSILIDEEFIISMDSWLSENYVVPLFSYLPVDSKLAAKLESEQMNIRLSQTFEQELTVFRGEIALVSR